MQVILINTIPIPTLTISSIGFDIVGQEEHKDFYINKYYEKQIDEVVESTLADTGARGTLSEHPFGLTFHTGESTLENGKGRQNLEFLAYYAGKVKKKFPHLQIRGGHTVLLSKDVSMRESYDNLNIHSELCLLSNNVLGTNNDASSYKTIYQQIVQHNSASLSGDDPTYQK